MNEPSSQTITENDATAAPDTELKEHYCTESCKNGQHVFAHGEKRHHCSEECLKNNNPSEVIITLNNNLSLNKNSKYKT